MRPTTHPLPALCEAWTPGQIRQQSGCPLPSRGLHSREGGEAIGNEDLPNGDELSGGNGGVMG